MSTLFDYAEAEQAKQNAIVHVEAGSRDFCEVAYETLKRVAARGQEFSSLDVWAEYDGPLPRSLRAMGAVINRASREGLIERTGRRIKSGRASDHNQFVECWKAKR